VIILAAAVYISRYLSKRTRTGGGGQSCIRVVDRVFVGKDQQVAVIAVNDRYFLVGIAQGGITNLGEFQQDEILRGENPTESGPSFKNVFLKSVKSSLGMSGKAGSSVPAGGSIPAKGAIPEGGTVLKKPESDAKDAKDEEV